MGLNRFCLIFEEKKILISDIISQLCIINCCTCFSAPCNSSYIICYFVWFALENITKLFCLKKKILRKRLF